MLTTLLFVLFLFQASADGTALPPKTVEGLNPNCSMTDIASALINDRSLVCAVGQTNFFQGEIRVVAKGIVPYMVGTPDQLQNAYELTSCACAENAIWTRTMVRVAANGTDRISWSWKMYARNADCSLVLKRDLVDSACSQTVACDCSEGEALALFDETPDESGQSECECQPISPVVIDLDGDGVKFTSRANGVIFDLDGDGDSARIPWTTDGWLVLLDKGLPVNGSAFFGDRSAQPWSMTPNGFTALTVFDDNDDDAITSADGVYSLLGIWRDANWNGVAEANEVQSLAAANVTSIATPFRVSGQRDQHGNRFRFRAKVTVNNKERWAYDVFVAGD